MDKSDRDIVVSRRRALLLVAAAAGLGCDKNGSAPLPHPEPMVCLSAPMPRCPDARFIVFSGGATTLSEDALATLDTLASQVVSGRSGVRLSVRVVDDGQAEAADALHQPRLDAVRQALVERRAADFAEIQPIEPQTTPMSAEEWLALTGDGNPIPLSGLVLVECP